MLPRQHPPTSAAGPADPSSGKNISRNSIWGTCDKYARKYRQELDTERMKDILQFCRDYQNRIGCTRQNCKFLHATKEEQNTFVATGQIPRVLAERHAAVAAAASNMQTNAETIPQIAMFISESQPPPAPRPPLPPPPAVLPPVATAPPPPPPSSPPRHAAALQSVQPTQQPPPPPAATSSALLRPAPSTYAEVFAHESTVPYSEDPKIPESEADVAANLPKALHKKEAVPQSPSVLFSVNQPPPLVLPPNFDATRPPPPIPSHMQASNNGQQLKRKFDANENAGTSKIRKPEGPEVLEVRCESCVQRGLRIDGYKRQMEALHNEEETQILLYKKKLQEYEIGRDILKTIVRPELFVVFDNLIEGAQTSQLDSPGSSFITGSPTVSKQALLQLFQMLLGGGTRNVIDPVSSTSHMDETLQSLTSISRRHNVASYANTGPDIIKFVVETLRNSSVPDRSPSVEERPNEPTDMNRVNRGSNGYVTNGQKAQPSTSEPVRYGAAAAYSAPSVQRPDFGSRAHAAMPNYSVAGPSGYTGAPTAAPPAPQAYPMFDPAVPPPPNRHYYPQNPVPGAPNMPYNGTERAPVPSQGMQPPAAPAALRPAANAPNYNYMGRYPQPHYFPPYQ